MSIDKKVLVVSEKSTLNNVIRELVNKPKPYFGFACIVNNSKQLKGVFNSGDLLRALSQGFTTECLITEVMTKNPITIIERELFDDFVETKLKQKLIKKFSPEKRYTKYLPVIDKDGILKDILTYEELIELRRNNIDSISVWGLGFVGITLMAAIGSKGFKVIGIDKSESLIKDLRKNKIHVHEQGLKESLQLSKANKVIDFSADPLKAKNSNIHIICVGTPVDKNMTHDLTSIKKVSESISSILKKDDLILIRSTVPIGTTRNTIIPILEQSKLKVNNDFHVAFTPERTIEGNALEEIFNIPQIIGGYSQNCLEKAELFWQNITSTTVSTSNLEAAEMTKLLNNSFRDLTFGFSNAFIEVATRCNLEANKVIKAANSGYSRSQIPIASPGVGGYCLTKDPYIYSSFDKNLNHSKLASLAREINSQSSFYPYETLEKYCKKIKKPLKNMNIFIIGLAFKGEPPTNDLRESSSLQTYRFLSKKVKNLFCYDHVLTKNDYDVPKDLNFKSLDYLSKSDAILILNNHQSNIKGDFFKLLNNNKRLLIFDGWGQIQKSQIEKNKLWTYSTLGYMT